MNLFEVVVGILISQLLRGSTSGADNAKAGFWWQIFQVPRFGGSFFAIFCDFGVLTLNLAFLTPKRHFLIRKDIYRCISWNSPISGVGCTLVEEPPKKGEKNAIEDVYVGCLPESDPLCKFYETWHGGSRRVRNHSDRFWSTPVNRFRCVATPKLSPCHRQGPSGLLHCGSRYRGNAWTLSQNMSHFHYFQCMSASQFPVCIFTPIMVLCIMQYFEMSTFTSRHMTLRLSLQTACVTWGSISTPSCRCTITYHGSQGAASISCAACVRSGDCSGVMSRNDSWLRLFCPVSTIVMRCWPSFRQSHLHRYSAFKMPPLASSSTCDERTMSHRPSLSCTGCQLSSVLSSNFVCWSTSR